MTERGGEWEVAREIYRRGERERERKRERERIRLHSH